MTDGTSDTTKDRVVLALPTSPGLRSIATLVLGGVGSRLDLPYEKVDDLQLAVLSLLVASDAPEVTIELELHDEQVDVRVGPLPAGSGADSAVRRVLERLVDRFESSAREDGDWITLGLLVAADGD